MDFAKKFMESSKRLQFKNIFKNFNFVIFRFELFENSNKKRQELRSPKKKTNFFVNSVCSGTFDLQNQTTRFVELERQNHFKIRWKWISDYFLFVKLKTLSCTFDFDANLTTTCNTM